MSPDFSIVYTLPKFNIAPEKLPGQQESSVPTIILQGTMLNFGRVVGDQSQSDQGMKLAATTTATQFSTSNESAYWNKITNSSVYIRLKNSDTCKSEK